MIIMSLTLAVIPLTRVVLRLRKTQAASRRLRQP